MFFLGLDLGQAADSSALALVETPHRRRDAPLHVRHLMRYPLGTSYPAIVDDVAERLVRPPLVGQVELIVDGSGVGRPVVDLFRKELRRVIAVTITAAGKAHRDEQNYWRVSKRDLIGGLQVALQTERLRIAAGIAEAPVLVHELQNYEVRITDSANDTYNARTGQHDDLVLALALACWRASDPREPGI